MLKLQKHYIVCGLQIKISDKYFIIYGIIRKRVEHIQENWLIRKMGVEYEYLYAYAYILEQLLNYLYVINKNYKYTQ